MIIDLQMTFVNPLYRQFWTQVLIPQAEQVQFNNIYYKMSHKQLTGSNPEHQSKQAKAASKEGSTVNRVTYTQEGVTTQRDTRGLNLHDKTGYKVKAWHYNTAPNIHLEEKGTQARVSNVYKLIQHL